ncbi:MAG TPA: hypothetical protein DD379_01835 [Cyanobacteria bacterium UBA11162]|nr:hypothetical protein [Cyanobacteria bacterium UBA11162]
MLDPGGLVLSRWYKKGKDKKGAREAVLICYDTSYVMKRFEQLFLNPLGMSAGEFGNAYYEWKVAQPVDSLIDSMCEEPDVEEI